MSLLHSQAVGPALPSPFGWHRRGRSTDRSGRAIGADHRASAGHLLVRTVVATGFFLGGILLFVAPVWWRNGETVLAARLMATWTGQRVVATSADSVIVLYKGTVSQMAFLVTNECTVGYLVGALLVLCAPIMMVRRIPRWRMTVALVAAVTCLVVTNVARLAAIGASVSRWGPTKGMTFGHSYLGPMVTLAGTCVAGALFVAILFFGSRRRAQPMVPRVVMTGTGE